MPWVYGYHLKWKIACDTAIEYKLVAQCPEFVYLKVFNHIQKVTKFRVWMAIACKSRVIVAFHDYKGEVQPNFEGMRFTVDEVIEVGKILGMNRGPRWYSYVEKDALLEVDSSGDERMSWDTPATISYWEHLRMYNLIGIPGIDDEVEENGDDGSGEEFESGSEAGTKWDTEASEEIQ